MLELEKALFQSGFVSGRTIYKDHYPGNNQDNRIVIPVNIAGKITTEMMVDTGGHWCVVHPEIIDELSSEIFDAYFPEEKLRIRSDSYNGKIVKLPLILPAVEGESIEVIASVFSPILPKGIEWGLPNFIGVTGFLDKIRFAVDPEIYAFYFGTTY